MNEAREEMLLRVRRALGKVSGDRAAEYASISRPLAESSVNDLELFAERLIDYGSTVYSSSPSTIASTVAQVLSSRGLAGLLVPAAIPAEWLPGGFEFVRDEGLTYQQMNESRGVLTGCAVAIALTGTIILRHSKEEGQRALTLIPDYHLCIVFEHQVVHSLSEAIKLTREFAAAPITTISGSSATSDIEMTRVKGVHGPRTLDVLLVRS